MSIHLECPRDGNPLVQRNPNAHPDGGARHCTRCEGMFVDRDMGLFARLEALRRGPEGLSEWEGGFSCPFCRQGMRGLAMGDAQLDLCFACHCAWLDSGELEKLEECRREADAPTASVIDALFRQVAGEALK